MPFTLSHAVLAPPLSKLSKGHLPIAALAIGCMTPDLYRLFTPENITLTHQWAGVLFPNLPIGLFFCLLWYLLYRPVLYRLFAIRDDLNIHSFDSFIAFSLMSCFAIIIGTATHLIWDGLTHLDFRTFAFKTVLAQQISLYGFTYPLHFILQIGSSIVALPFIFWMCWHYYQSHKQTSLVPQKIKTFAVVSLIISVLGGLLSIWDYSRHIASEIWLSEPYFFIGKSINEFTQTGLILFTVACLLLLFLDRKAYKA
ncbi:DUF4184 family protein [Acinetobacter haemolyticus]|uniref:DUF4184 family protein n=1 Tax=Acinetobacter haemolyticus TaxID=29430 RepID=UPI00137244CB|nr:DUF4184 family protein [Acinetobacter haemolyticus]NAR29410.1 DUF4184 family protein [Acinetobacter haemolyticus]NAR76083.1 DUF4184 family protein [Acinetobacter haemolyticus]NCU22092.1 DUF4184 family protein [Acinetobacter haemolyticus]